MLLRLGSSGKHVEALQELLGLVPDGDFGPLTDEAVRHFQQTHGLKVDGIVGNDTWNMLGLASTDNAEHNFMTENGLFVTRDYLPKSEYKTTYTSKHFLFLHHTSGWHNPYNCIHGWKSDRRGAVATEFVIGGQSIRGDSTKHDGDILQSFPEGYWGWHLGIGRSYMHSHSVGIEVCNFGWLLQRNNAHYAYVAKNSEGNWRSDYTRYRVVDAQVVKLKKKFREKQYWHRYSDAQLDSLRGLILHIAERDNIDVRAGLVEEIREEGAYKAFSFKADVRAGQRKGMWTHTNVRTDKTDMFPQDELVDMLMSL